MPQASITTVLRRDVVESSTLSPRREARLLPEHARFYPGVAPGVWESAAMLADRVLADGLLRGGRDRVAGPDPVRRTLRIPRRGA